MAVMIQDELTYRIRQALGLVPTAEQEQAIDVFSQFMTDRDEQVVMILRGSAGTGKTTLAAAIVKALAALKQVRRRSLGLQPEQQPESRHLIYNR